MTARGSDRSSRGAAHRVCHISTVHPSNDSRVFWREAVGLAGLGYDVTLVARADHDRVDHGVRVIGLPTYRRRLTRMTVGVARAFRAGLRSKAEVVHLHDPELIPLIPAFRLMGRRVVYDAHEWLSRQVAAKDYLGPVTRAITTRSSRGLETFVGRAASHVVTVNAACAAIYPAAKVTVVANYPDLAQFDAPPTDSTVGSPPSFAYVGTISAARGIREMVDALPIVNATDPARLTVVGEFRSQTLRDEVGQSAGWQYVDYPGRVPHEQVSGYLRSAVAGLATLLPTPNHLISSPVKVFEYLAMGLPVIISDFPAWREMLDGVDCAIWVDPTQSEAIAEAMRTLLRDPERRAAMGLAARRAIVERFNWSTQLDNLATVYRAMLA